MPPRLFRRALPASLAPVALAFAFAFAFAFALALACSSGSTSSSSSSGATTPSDAGIADAGADTGADAAPKIVQSCSTYADHTSPSDARSFAWGFSLAQSPDRCSHVTVGESVTFTGDFAMYPLSGEGGDTPNPMTGLDESGASVTVKFTKAGTFGFACSALPALAGAIEVTP